MHYIFDAHIADLLPRLTVNSDNLVCL